MSKVKFVLKNQQGDHLEEFQREKPNLRKLAKQYGRRCEKERLAIYRVEPREPIMMTGQETFEHVFVAYLESEKKNVTV